MATRGRQRITLTPEFGLRKGIDNLTNEKLRVRDQLMHGDAFVAWEAAESLGKDVRPTDLPLLADAYAARAEYALRAEIVDMIGLVRSDEACRFLAQVAKSRAHPLVRYYAMRNLIDLDCGDWRPATVRQLKSEFYASLLAYERHVRGEIKLETLRSLARDRTRRRGDHWSWLADLSPRRSLPPKTPKGFGRRTGE